jgi:hypothetical protein
MVASCAFNEGGCCTEQDWKKESVACGVKSAKDCNAYKAKPVTKKGKEGKKGE